jgi:hypothetical protein
MATISKLNNVLCVSISKIDNILKSNVKYFDDNTFCPQTTPTPTQTSVTPTPTPTQTPASVTPTPTETPANTPTPTPTATRAGQKCIKGTIPKDTEYSYGSCCYPYGQITGTTGAVAETVCYEPFAPNTNVTAVSPEEQCEISALTRCCEIHMSYTELFPFDPCDMGGTAVDYYISAPCGETLCDLTVALAIYEDDSCTTVAPDGYYTDGIGYASINGGSYTYGGPC